MPIRQGQKSEQHCTCVTDVKDVSESLNVDAKTFLVFVFWHKCLFFSFIPSRYISLFNFNVFLIRPFCSLEEALSPEESLSCDFLWGLYFYEYSRVCLVLFCFLLLFFVASVFRFLFLYLKFNFPIYSSNQSPTHSSHITLTSGEQRNWSPTKEAPDCQTNSPQQHLRKCIENSMENMHTDVRV